MKPFAFALLVAISIPASAATVYRCGPDGREYSHTPCTQGGRSITVDDSRSAQEQSQAQDVALRDRQLGAALERTRRQAEAGPRASAMGFDSRAAAPHASRDKAAASKVLKKRGANSQRPKEPTTFIAPPAPGGS